jgi:hypothetical protein
MTRRAAFLLALASASMLAACGTTVLHPEEIPVHSHDHSENLIHGLSYQVYQDDSLNLQDLGNASVQGHGHIQGLDVSIDPNKNKGITAFVFSGFVTATNPKKSVYTLYVLTEGDAGAKAPSKVMLLVGGYPVITPTQAFTTTADTVPKKVWSGEIKLDNGMHSIKLYYSSTRGPVERSLGLRLKVTPEVAQDVQALDQASHVLAKTSAAVATAKAELDRAQERAKATPAPKPGENPPPLPEDKTYKDAQAADNQAKQDFNKAQEDLKTARLLGSSLSDDVPASYFYSRADDGQDLIQGFSDFYQISLIPGIEMIKVKGADLKQETYVELRIYQPEILSDRLDGFAQVTFHGLSYKTLNPAAVDLTPLTVSESVSFGGGFFFQLFQYPISFPSSLVSVETLQGAVGPVIKADYALRTQNRDQGADAQFSDYIGLRSAFNPDYYLDATVGRSEELRRLRWEFATSVPIFRDPKTGARIFFTGIANIGIHDTKDNTFSFGFYIDLPLQSITNLNLPFLGQYGATPSNATPPNK